MLLENVIRSHFYELNFKPTKVSSSQSAIGTIQLAANGFSENMIAMQSSFLLKGYFKRKAKADANPTIINAVELDSLNQEDELDEMELRMIIAEAQKALDAKKKKN